MSKAKGNGRGRGALRLYASYMFRNKDPEIDRLRTVIEGHFGERVSKKRLREIAEAGGPTAGAMAGWFFGVTRRPQSATLEAAGRAIGFERVWRKQRGKA